MNQLTLRATQEQLKRLLGDICLRPELPADLAEELRQIYFVLRNHTFYMDFLKRQLDEMGAEIDQL